MKFKETLIKYGKNIINFGVKIVKTVLMMDNKTLAKAGIIIGSAIVTAGVYLKVMRDRARIINDNKLPDDASALEYGIHNHYNTDSRVDGLNSLMTEMKTILRGDKCSKKANSWKNKNTYAFDTSSYEDAENERRRRNFEKAVAEVEAEERAAKRRSKYFNFGDMDSDRRAEFVFGNGFSM